MMSVPLVMLHIHYPCMCVPVRGIGIVLILVEGFPPTGKHF
jgi:hypothetical protein